jgi:hypothetical protein
MWDTWWLAPESKMNLEDGVVSCRFVCVDRNTPDGKYQSSLITLSSKIKPSALQKLA